MTKREFLETELNNISKLLETYDGKAWEKYTEGDLSYIQEDLETEKECFEKVLDILDTMTDTMKEFDFGDKAEIVSWKHYIEMSIRKVDISITAIQSMRKRMDIIMKQVSSIRNWSEKMKDEL